MTTHATVRPVAPAFGAEVVGIDLADASSETIALVSRALADHAVLFVRDQHLTPEQQVELTRRFGGVLRVPYISPLAEHPDVVAVLKEADERNISTFGGRPVRRSRGRASGGPRPSRHRQEALFVNPMYTQRLDDMSVEESRPLLQYLLDHATRAEFTCRLRWTHGTLAIWDNRCLLHLAVNDHDGSRRLLHRTTVAGEAPVAPP